MSSEGTAAAATTTTETPWYDGADAETVGHLQSHGWDKKTAKDAAFDAIKSYREAEKRLGAPPDSLLRLPKDPNDPAWNSVYQRLGAGGEAKDYDLSGVKFSDDSALDDGFIAALQPALLAANVRKDKAPEIVRAVVKYMEDAEKADAAVSADAVQKEADALKANWGANFNANWVVAENAMKALGVTDEEAKALKNTIGGARAAEMFRKIGAQIGEDRFITNAVGGGGNGIMTKEQAQAKLSELKRDQAWVTKLLSGDVVAKREEENLTRMIAGV